MPKIVEVIHTGGGSLVYRFKGKGIKLTEGDKGEMFEEVYNQHKDKLILEKDAHFLKISPDYKGEPKQFDQPRPINPLAQRAVDAVERNQVQIDDGLEALRAKLKDMESQWVGKSTQEYYISHYGKGNKKTKLAQEIVRLRALIAEAEVSQ